jgi:hypothetical protein
MRFPGFFYTPLGVNKDKVDEQNDQAMDEVMSFINGLDLVAPGDTVLDGPLDNPANSLMSGSHSIRQLNNAGASITGVGGGASIRTPLRLSRRHIIDGVEIKPDEEFELDPVVSIGSLSVAVFRNCVFHRRRGNASQVWVDVASGGKAIFIGCMFLSSVDVLGGVIINNAGAAANVQVVGCYNGTGLTFAGVTSAALGNL